MAVAFSTSQTQEHTGDGTGSWTFNFTASGSNTYVLLWFFTLNRTVDSTGITYGGTAMTSIDSQDDGAGGSSRRTRLYGIKPASGEKAIVVSLSATNAVDYGAIVCLFTGVDQTTPYGTAQKDKSPSADPSKDFTLSADGGMVCDAVHVYPTGAFLAAAGQTTVDDIYSAMKVSYKAGTGTTNMAWSITPDDWAYIGLPLNPSVSKGSMMMFL